MRIFVGIDLPKDLKEKIFEVSQKVAKQIPLRLVTKENLHLTLVFLGIKTDEETERIKKAVSEATSGLEKLSLTLENLEFFPASRPRGIWFKIGGETEKLRTLHKKIIDALFRNGIKVEDLRFTPHTCVGRFKGGRTEDRGRKIDAGRQRTEDRKKIGEINFGEKFTAEKVTVFESKLSSKGPTYLKLGEFSLKLT